MPSITVSSFLRNGDNFVPIDQFDGDIRDILRIEGYIELTIGGTPLLTQVEFDYVDQLWAYFCRGLGDLAQGEDFRTYLPDQPVEVAFLQTNDRQHVRVLVRYTDVHRSVTVPIDEFTKVMTGAARSFFKRMVELVPENRAAYEDSLLKLPTHPK